MKRLQVFWFWAILVLFCGVLRIYAQSAESNSASKAMAVGPLVYSSHFIDDVPGGTSPNGDGDGRAESGEHVGLAVFLFNQGNQTAVDVKSTTLTCSDPDVTVLDQLNCWPDIPGGQTAENACNYEFQVNPNLAQNKTVLFTMAVIALNGGPWTSTFAVQIFRQNQIQSDLVADRVYLRSAPGGGGSEVDNPLPGQQYYVSIEYRNVGAGTTGNFRWEAQINGNAICFFDESVVGNSSWVRDCSNPVIWPCSSPATSNTIQLVLDVYNSVAESNENNNSVSRTYICPSTAKPDLIPTALTFSPASVNVGGAINLNGIITNIGTTATIANCNVKFYLSTNPNGPDIGLLLYSFFIPSLGVGQTNNFNQTGTVPANAAPGFYYVWMSIDPDNTIQEGNETNNQLRTNSQMQVIGTPPPCPLTWKVDVTVQDAGSNSALLSFGLGATATNDIDPACGEAELPPAPPSGIFDARLELPVSPAKASLKDYRNSSLQTVTWRVRFQPGVNGPMTFSWNPANFPAGSVYLKDEITGTLVNVNMKTQSSYTLTNPAISPLKIEYRTIECKDVTVVAGWNVVSIPFSATDMTASALFPDAASQAFAFNNGYTTAMTLTPGKGYWIKFNTAKTYNICGIPVTPKRIPVVVGWNIIGPFESDVAVASITSIPANIIVSSYFGYNNGYTQATTLSVGKGYWVKASAAGELILPAGAMAKQTAGSEAAPMAQQPEVNANWPILLIADNKGNLGRIYLAPATEMKANFELPPTPPVGIFDVRFSSGRYVETLERGALEIQINSASYPIRIKAQNLGAHALNVKAMLGGNALHETLTSGKEIVVSKATNKIMVETAMQLPSRYALSQNYPNPFNPATMIRFTLPEKGHVKLTVYNIVGEKVAELVNQEFPAGYHQVEFNASSLASGIYFYEMKAGDFRDLKKLVVAQ